MNSPMSTASSEHLLRLLKEALGTPPSPDATTKLVESPGMTRCPPEAETVMKDPAKKVGRYWPVSLLGAGGMGKVYRAWDAELQRWVALKLLKDPLDPLILPLFKREAYLSAGLDHPGIAKIFEVGEHRSTGEDTTPLPFIAMQLIEGETLSTAVARLDLRLKVVVLRQVAEAIRYAHERGIIHRDLKPANVMVDRSGNVFLMDLGVAKETGADPKAIPATSLVVGTPSYMAPEQARGKADTRSDIYGLGAILYELTTGSPPFVGGSATEVIARILSEDPVRPRAMAPKIPVDLEAIVLKCLEKDKGRRYEHVGRLLEDLDAYLAGNPLRYARPPTIGYILAKRIRKQPLLWGLGAALVLAILGGGAFGIYWLFRAKAAAGAQARTEAQERRRTEVALGEAERQRSRAEDQTRLERSRLAQVYLLQEERARKSGDFPHAAVYAAEADMVSSSRASRVRAAFAAFRLPRLEAILPEEQGLTDLALSADGHTLALLSEGGAVSLWDLRGKKRLAGKIQGVDGIQSIRVNREGTALATVESNIVRFWRLPDATEFGKALELEERIGSVSFSPDWKRIVVCEDLGKTVLWNGETRTKIVTLMIAGGEAALSLDGSLLVTGTPEGVVELREAGSGAAIRTLADSGPVIRQVAFATVVAAGGLDGSVRVWDPKTGALLGSAAVEGESVLHLEFDPTGERFVTVSSREVLQGWSSRTCRSLGPSIRLKDWTPRTAWSSDGRTVGLCGLTSVAQLLDATSMTRAEIGLVHDGNVSALAFHPDGRRVITAGMDGACRIWFLPEERTRRVALPEEVESVPVSLDPEGKRLLAITASRHSFVLDLETRKTTRLEQDRSPASAEYSPEGRWIATVDGHRLRIWEASTGKPLDISLRHDQRISSFAFSSVPGRVATADEDGRVLLWDLPSGKRLDTEMKHPFQVDEIEFGPGDTRIATTSLGMVRLWDAATGRLVATLSPSGALFGFGPEGGLLAVGGESKLSLHSGETGGLVGKIEACPLLRSAFAFSADGRRMLATRVDFKTLVLWILPEGWSSGVVLPHDDLVVSARFTPDEKGIVTCTKGGSIRFWDAEDGALLAGPIRLGFPPTHLRVFPEGNRMAVVGFKDGVVLLDVTFLSDEMPPELRLLQVEACTGLRMDARGRVAPMPVADWQERSREWDRRRP